MRNFVKNYWAVFIPVAVLAAALVYLLKEKSEDTPKDAIIGMVDAEFVDVSASLPGRVLEISVKEGDEVKEGQTVEIKAEDRNLPFTINYSDSYLGKVIDPLCNVQKIDNDTAESEGVDDTNIHKFILLYCASLLLNNVSPYALNEPLIFLQLLDTILVLIIL